MALFGGSSGMLERIYPRHAGCVVDTVRRDAARRYAMARSGKNGALVTKYPWLAGHIEPGVPDNKLEVVEVDREVFGRRVERCHHGTSAYLLLFDKNGQRLKKVRGHRYFDNLDKTIAKAVDSVSQRSLVAFMLFIDNSFYAERNFSFYYARKGLIAPVLDALRQADEEKATEELEATLPA